LSSTLPTPCTKEKKGKEKNGTLPFLQELGGLSLEWGVTEIIPPLNLELIYRLLRIQTLLGSCLP
jgi:hypothetical protein